jgi:hypothetical protein
MNQFQLTPDANLGGGTTPKTVHHTGNLPSKDADLATLGMNAANEWANHPILTLLWKTQPDYAKEALDFEKIFGQKLTASALRPSQTRVLANYDAEIERNTKFVKGYIFEKWKTDDLANYPRYGIFHRGEHWEIPRDHDKRLDSLVLMIQAIHDDGFDGREFGKAYWDKMRTDYEKAFKDTTNTDGSISSYDGDKDVLREQVKKVLNALIHLVIANYPDTYKHELRKFGYQKEDY